MLGALVLCLQSAARESHAADFVLGRENHHAAVVPQFGHMWAVKDNSSARISCSSHLQQVRERREDRRGSFPSSVRQWRQSKLRTTESVLELHVWLRFT